MTKKHFIELADHIRIYNRYASEPFTERQISELADFCKSQNYRFDRERVVGLYRWQVWPFRWQGEAKRGVPCLASL